MKKIYQLSILTLLIGVWSPVFCVFGSPEQQARKLLEDIEFKYQQEINFSCGWFNCNISSIVHLQTGHTEMPFCNYIAAINQDIATLNKIAQEFNGADARRVKEIIYRLNTFKNYVHSYHGNEFQKEHECRKKADYKKIPGYAIEQLEKNQEEMTAEYKAAQSVIDICRNAAYTIDSLKRQLAYQESELNSQKKSLRQQEEKIRSQEAQINSLQVAVSRLQHDFVHHEQSVSAHQAPPPAFNPAYNPGTHTNNPPPTFVQPPR